MPKSFTDVLNQLRAGETSDELTEKYAALTLKCADSGRPGSITITMTLKPGKSGQIEVFDEIKVKEPKMERSATLMFATPEGSLQREDPRQKELPGLRRVDTSTGEIVSSSAG
jgi:hypothetical protein